MRHEKSRTVLAGAMLLVALTSAAPALAGQVLVAVAANFAEVVEALRPGFEASGHELEMTSGSTGKLYAQIVNGAPFDVLLAADRERPEQLEAEGQGVPGSRFTYAVGRLTLWSPDPARVGADGAATLKAGRFRALAIANPDLAPYGAAARETLAALGLEEALADRIVMGENIGQAHAMVATGNAELGLLALSSVLSPRNKDAGSRWDVPADLHAPIRQDALLLARAADNEAARAFLDHLRGEEAIGIIRGFGYGVE